MYFKKDRTIYLSAGITDMRKQINGLARIANEKKADSVFSGDYLVFLGKTRKTMKECQGLNCPPISGHEGGIG